MYIMFDNTCLKSVSTTATIKMTIMKYEQFRVVWGIVR